MDGTALADPLDEAKLAEACHALAHEAGTDPEGAADLGLGAAGMKGHETGHQLQVGFVLPTLRARASPMVAGATALPDGGHQAFPLEDSQVVLDVAKPYAEVPPQATRVQPGTVAQRLLDAKAHWVQQRGAGFHAPAPGAEARRGRRPP